MVAIFIGKSSFFFGFPLLVVAGGNVNSVDVNRLLLRLFLFIFFLSILKFMGSFF